MRRWRQVGPAGADRTVSPGTAAHLRRRHAGPEPAGGTPPGRARFVPSNTDRRPPSTPHTATQRICLSQPRAGGPGQQCMERAALHTSRARHRIGHNGLSRRLFHNPRRRRRCGGETPASLRSVAPRDRPPSGVPGRSEAGRAPLRQLTVDLIDTAHNTVHAVHACCA